MAMTEKEIADFIADYDKHDSYAVAEREAIMEYEADVERDLEKRTKKQNRAEHKWFRQVAEALNDGGYTVQEVVKVPISFTEEWVKRYLFLRVAQVMYEKEHTSELTKEQTSKCVEELNLILGERFGIHVPFPAEE